MRRFGYLLLAASFLALVWVACSNSEADDSQKADSKVPDSTEVKKSTSDPYYDSLAQVHHKVRSKDNKLVTLETNFGKMTLELFRDVAPHHADSFVARSQDGFYDSTIFHRIVKNFMIQGGDPTGTGRGNAGYYLPDEFSDLPHVEGTISMASSGRPNSSSSQFFICLQRNRNTEGLDGKYTVFGHLIKGYDVLHHIADVKCGPRPGGENSKPVETVHLYDAYLSDAEGKPVEEH